jgi:RNA polymerase sigma factor (sigma-70 family)
MLIGGSFGRFAPSLSFRLPLVDLQGKGIGVFALGRVRAPETTSDALQALALALQPLLREREWVLIERALPAAERARRLGALGRRMRRAGLGEFHRLVERVCRSYCARYGGTVQCRFEVEDFVTEVLTLTCTQLVAFDPKVARFSTWFSTCVLPRVYSDMQRRIDPGWGRPQPKTDSGRLLRREAFNATRSLSLDQTFGSDQPISERVADPAGCAEKQLLEGQCQESFLQAVCCLGAAEQVLLRRVYVLHEPQKDIADALGVTPAAISLRLKRIYQRLADLLGEPFEAECADTHFCEALRRLP